MSIYNMLFLGYTKRAEQGCLLAGRCASVGEGFGFALHEEVRREDVRNGTICDVVFTLCFIDRKEALDGKRAEKRSRQAR